MAQDLQDLRNEIDKTDDILWDAILHRQQLARLIGEWKRQHHVAPLQTERYQQILTKRLEWAREHQIPESLVKNILENLHFASLTEQNVKKSDTQ